MPAFAQPCLSTGKMSRYYFQKELEDTMGPSAARTYVASIEAMDEGTINQYRQWSEMAQVYKYRMVQEFQHSILREDRTTTKRSAEDRE
eukprot:6459157-Amphidinium_carterae.1